MTGAVWIFLAALVVFAALVGVMPLRGGNGQHAHAGPGTVDVWRLREVIAAQQDIAEPEDIVWPDEDPDTGRHRMVNVDMLCHRIATAIVEHGGQGRRRFPLPMDVCYPPAALR
ncbi:hypothetical protein GCM10011581_18800 [Saccharopolyspora subtropica]|uniref:Uncharacterized protein n=1 Tax=Saccharopolyspora thermophila TaxID=89367 RepID=A0A917JRW9_9PSEU|nr:hypothetical protein [Saccharopolyspora subtropica]GGI81583.1 hypothetical protein GCM10011581_18800 [Saccharopolyspora subtropica]